MKQPKKLTSEQKQIVSNNGLIANNWMFLEDLGSYLKIINKSSKKTKIVDKYRKRNVSTPTKAKKHSKSGN